MHQLNLYSFLCCSQAACFSHPFVKSRKSARQNEITASNIKILLIQTRRQIHIQYGKQILKMKILESEFRYIIYQTGAKKIYLAPSWHRIIFQISGIKESCWTKDSSFNNRNDSFDSSELGKGVRVSFLAINRELARARIFMSPKYEYSGQNIKILVLSGVILAFMVEYWNFFQMAFAKILDFLHRVKNHSKAPTRYE